MPGYSKTTSLPPIHSFYHPLFQTTTRRSKTPSLPLILQEERLHEMFSPLEKYMSRLEEAYLDPIVKDNPQNLGILQKEVENFTTALRELNMIIINTNPNQTSIQADIPRGMKRKMRSMIVFVLSLDRVAQHGFIVKIRNYNNRITRRAFELDQKILWALRPHVVGQRRRRSVLLEQAVQAPVLQPPPPPLSRSSARHFVFP